MKMLPLLKLILWFMLSNMALAETTKFMVNVDGQARIDTESLMHKDGFIQYQVITNYPQSVVKRDTKRTYQYYVNSTIEYKMFHCGSASQTTLFTEFYEKLGNRPIYQTVVTETKLFEEYRQGGDWKHRKQLTDYCKIYKASSTAIPYKTVSSRRSAPVKVDVSTIAPGQWKEVTWNGQSILIYYRTKQQIESLKDKSQRRYTDYSGQMTALSYFKRFSSSTNFIDPLWLKARELRSITPEFLVVNRTSPSHCLVTVNPKNGGFLYDSCRGYRFDLAGRAFRGSSTNLTIPPHEFVATKQLLIGTHDGNSEALIPVDPVNPELLPPDYLALRSATKNDVTGVKLALEKGANVNTSLLSKTSLLNLAVRKGNVDMAKLLLASGAQVNRISELGYLPIDLALSVGNIDMAKLLVEHRSPVGIVYNSSGQYSKHAICLGIHYNYLAVFEFLKSNGFNPFKHWGFMSPCVDALPQEQQDLFHSMFSLSDYVSERE